jgi:hypothetical protein
MPDARWNDPREYDDRDRGDVRPRVYGERERDDHDPRASLMQYLDLPRGEERELVVDRDRVYELNGEDSRTLCRNRTTSTQTTTPFATSATKVSSRLSTLVATSAA